MLPMFSTEQLRACPGLTEMKLFWSGMPCCLAFTVDAPWYSRTGWKPVLLHSGSRDHAQHGLAVGDRERTPRRVVNFRVRIDAQQMVDGRRQVVGAHGILRRIRAVLVGG